MPTVEKLPTPLTRKQSRMSFIEQIQLFINNILGGLIHDGSSAISQTSSALNLF